MRQTDEVFATVLLLSQLTINRNELARPLTTAEWYRFRETVRASRVGSLGNLLGMDISALQQELGIPEQDAFRIFSLLNRTVHLSYVLEKFFEKGIDIVTIGEEEYPKRLVERLGEKAPPMLYYAGDLKLCQEKGILMAGAGNMKEAGERCVQTLVDKIIRAGYLLITGGTRGVDWLIEQTADECGGKVVSFLAEALVGKLAEPGVQAMVSGGRMLLLSTVHPEAPFTMTHALNRNKCLYTLAQSAFIVTADAQKGSTWEGAMEALRKKWADKIFVWDNECFEGNRQLILNGAMPVKDVEALSVQQLVTQWQSPSFEQISLF